MSALAFLGARSSRCRVGRGDVIITEDSDLLVFCAATGVAVPVLFKMGDDGCFDLVLQLDQDLGAKAVAAAAQDPASCGPFVSKMREDFSLRMFVQCCILAGCDYSAGLVGVGLRKAQDLVLKFKGAPEHERLATIVKHVGEKELQRQREATAKLARKNSRTGGTSSTSSTSSSQPSTSQSQDEDDSVPVTPRGADAAAASPSAPPDYALIFARIELAFMHQSVFDPVKLEMTHLLELPPKVRDDGPTSGCAWNKLQQQQRGAGDNDTTATIDIADGDDDDADGSGDADAGFIRPSTLDLNFLGPPYPPATVARVARGVMNPRLVKCSGGGGADDDALDDTASAAAASVFPLFSLQASRAAAASSSATPRAAASSAAVSAQSRARSVFPSQQQQQQQQQQQPAVARRPAPAPGADLDDMIQAAQELERSQLRSLVALTKERDRASAAAEAGATMTPSPHRRGGDSSAGFGGGGGGASGISGLAKKARLTEEDYSATGAHAAGTHAGSDAANHVTPKPVHGSTNLGGGRLKKAPAASSAASSSLSVSPLRSAKKTVAGASSSSSAAAAAAAAAASGVDDIASLDTTGDVVGNSDDDNNGDEVVVEAEEFYVSTKSRPALNSGSSSGTPKQSAANKAGLPNANARQLQVHAAARSMSAVSTSFLQRSGKFKQQGTPKAQSIKNFFVSRAQ